MTTKERTEVEDLIGRLDALQVQSTMLLHDARRTLQNALSQLEDAREQTAAARAQVTQVTAECDRLRAECDRYYRESVAKTVPPVDNPNP